MRRKTHLRLLILVIVSVFNSAFAQFEIRKFTINNGGGYSSGTNYELTGSVGQADANNKSTNGGISVSGGFWTTGQRNENLFKDGFE